MLRGQAFEYAFCGGWAIDLFLGYESRKHGDIDIHAYWADRDAIILHMQSLGFEAYEMLGGGKAHRITDVNDQRRIKRNIFCCKQDCELVQLSKTEEAGVCFVDFQHTGQTRLDFIEFLFNHKSAHALLYARNHVIKRELSKAILSNNGMAYLAPEICLLYKSTDIQREGYQQDYERAISKMDGEQKQWLNAALHAMYPGGHKWLE